jgi:hypothetical protein
MGGLRSHRAMDYYRVKGLRHGRESHIKINLATVSMEICSQAIVGENNDVGVSQRRLGNSVIQYCSPCCWIPGIWLPEWNLYALTSSSRATRAPTYLSTYGKYSYVLKTLCCPFSMTTININIVSSWLASRETCVLPL